MPLAGPIATITVTPFFGLALMFGPVMVTESHYLNEVGIAEIFQPVVEELNTSREKGYLITLSSQNWKFKVKRGKWVDPEQFRRPLKGTIKTGVFGNTYLLKLE